MVSTEKKAVNFTIRTLATSVVALISLPFDDGFSQELCSRENALSPQMEYLDNRTSQVSFRKSEYIVALLRCSLYSKQRDVLAKK